MPEDRSAAIADAGHGHAPGVEITVRFEHLDTHDWVPNRQAIQDKITGTAVVRDRRGAETLLQEQGA